MRVLHAALGYRDPIVHPMNPEVGSQSSEPLRIEFRRWLSGGQATSAVNDVRTHGPLATALAGFAAHKIPISEVRLYAAAEDDPDVAVRLTAAKRLLPLVFPAIRFTPVALGTARVFEYHAAFDAIARHWRAEEGEETHILLGPGTPQLNAALVFRAAGRGLKLWQVTTPKRGLRLESVGAERYLREVRFGEGALPALADRETTKDLRARAAEAELDRIASAAPGLQDERLDYRAVLRDYELALWAKAALREATAARRGAQTLHRSRRRTSWVLGAERPQAAPKLRTSLAAAVAFATGVARGLGEMLGAKLIGMEAQAPLGLDTPASDAAVLAPRESHVHEPLPRPRDARGRRPENVAFRLPHFGHAPSEQTHLEELCARFERGALPREVLAQRVRLLHDEGLLPKVRRAARLHAEAYAALDRERQEVLATNADAEAQSDAVRRQMDDDPLVLAAREDEAKALQVEEDARLHASSACADAGLPLPETVDPAAAFAVVPTTLDEAAADFGLTLSTPPSRFVKLFAKPVGSVLQGMALGVSFGVVAGFLDPTGLADAPYLLGAVALVGVSFGGFAGAGLGTAFRHAAESRRARRYVVAAGGLALLGTAYVMMERQAVLKAGVMLEQPVPPLTALFCAAVVSMPYLLYCAYAGHADGRREHDLALARARQKAMDAEREAARRADPNAQRAAAALSALLGAGLGVAGAARRLVRVEGPYRTELAMQDARRHEAPEDLNAETKLLLQDAADDVEGAQHLLDLAMTAAEAAAGGRRGGLLARLFGALYARLVFGARRRTRQERV